MLRNMQTLLQPQTSLERGMSLTKKTHAASLFSRQQDLGVPMHMEMPYVFMNIDDYTLLISGGQLYCPYY